MRVALMISEDVENLTKFNFLKETEADLGARTDNRVVGRLSAVSAMIRAFAKYGRHEYAVCPVGVPDIEDWEELKASVPLPLLAPKELMAWVEDSPSVLFELARHRLSRLANLRSVLGSDRLHIGAQMHGLGDPRLVDDLCVSLLSPILDSDVIFAPSRAAHLALQTGFVEAQSIIRDRGGAVELPYIEEIMLGIDCKQFSRGNRPEARRELGWPDEEFVFLSLGRLSDSDKFDHRPLIRAFANSASSWPGPTKLVIAGNDGNDRTRSYVSDLRELVRELDLTGSVEIRNHFPPSLRRTLYTGADAFLALSDSVGESFGLTVTEAQSASLPVIATDWNGYRDQIDHGQSGWLIPSTWSDQLENGAHWQLLTSGRELDLASAQTVAIDWNALLITMQHIVRMSCSERAAIGDAGCRSALGRDWSRVVGRYEEVWERQSRLRSQSGRDTRTRRSHIFRGHATRILTSSMHIALGPLFDTHGAHLDPRWDLKRTVCDAQLADSIVSLILSSKGHRSSIESVERCFKEIPKGIMHWHILWLLKNDFLKISEHVEVSE